MNFLTLIINNAIEKQTIEHFSHKQICMVQGVRALLQVSSYDTPGADRVQGLAQGPNHGHVAELGYELPIFWLIAQISTH